ncbi:hypothetical protein [Metamycoplasma neophronis]|uniref:Lipoprotein n=1 Tax=Metamycoplasma neophronis TaxID=872983 RepID=A0ABY2Z0L0_9BACT|nr:hypothetical protein [Metamycoplasma neophronis]TPR54053.1 hypothetical protein FJR74_01260 [Metamycoplasma neophronis]
MNKKLKTFIISSLLAIPGSSLLTLACSYQSKIDETNDQQNINSNNNQGSNNNQENTTENMTKPNNQDNMESDSKVDENELENSFFEGGTLNGLTSNKFINFAKLYDLNANALASQNLERLQPKNWDDIDLIITGIEIISLSDEKGLIAIKINGKYNKKSFDNLNINISGFAKPTQAESVEITFNKNYFIENRIIKSKLASLTQEELLNALSNFSIFSYSKNNKKYVIEIKNNINTDDNNFVIKNLSLSNDGILNINVYQKVFEINNNVKTSKEISFINKSFSVLNQIEYSKQDIFNFIFENNKIIPTDLTFNKEFLASEYASSWYAKFLNQGTLANNFYQVEPGFENWLDFNETNPNARKSLIYFSTNSVLANDLTGTLFINQSLTWEDDYSEIEKSHGKTYQVNGFNQINESDLTKWFNLVIKNELINKIAKNYIDDPKINNYKEAALEKLLRKADNNFVFIKPYDFNNIKVNREEILLHENRSFYLEFGYPEVTNNSHNLIDNYDSHTAMIKFNKNENNGFSIYGLNANIASINVESINQANNTINLNLNATLNILLFNSNNEQFSWKTFNIPINHTISYHYEID